MQSSVVRYDVVGHPGANFFFTVVFPFHPAKHGKPAQVRGCVSDVGRSAQMS